MRSSTKAAQRQSLSVHKQPKETKSPEGERNRPANWDKEVADLQQNCGEKETCPEGVQRPIGSNADAQEKRADANKNESAHGPGQEDIAC